jgi:HSP20 family molecular chaperone IbpA
MNTFDLSPVWQSTVGFDRPTNLMEDSVRRMGGDNYPPYDIERVGEDHYQISLALAGFGTCWRSKVARPRRAATSISTKASLRVRSVGCSLWLRAGEGSLENGVLTITMPKLPQAEAKVKRIAINSK